MPKRITNWNKEELMKKHDFDYIRKHFYDRGYTLDDIRKDIIEVYNDNLQLNQLSAEGKNTVRVTNYFVMETQMKATTIRSRMSPHDAVFDDDALCQILHRVDTHPRFFNIRAEEEKKLQTEGFDKDILTRSTEGLNDAQKSYLKYMQDYYKERLNLADIREVRRALAQMPTFGRVSQFPNHVAQRIYEKYCPKKNAIILDSSSGWGNRLMAAMSSKYSYKYLGTDPNSEMHPNYRALANTIYETVYESQESEKHRKYPEDYLDIRDQGSEFDIPEWHNLSGYLIDSSNDITKLKNKFTNVETILSPSLDVPEQERHGIQHPNVQTGKGCCDTGTLNTTGAKLEPIWNTHDPEIFNSGIGDLSFTSPPYFFLECYTPASKAGKADGQSAGKGSNYRKWLKEFVYPTVVNHFNYLKPGAYYIYNLKDLDKDKMFIYSDWMSICMDVGFELVTTETMVLKAKRQFNKDQMGEDAIDFNGDTEKVGVLRKPLTPTDRTIKPDSNDALYHIQHMFIYPLIKSCRPEKFQSFLDKGAETYLEDKFHKKYKKEDN